MFTAVSHDLQMHFVFYVRYRRTDLLINVINWIIRLLPDFNYFVFPSLGKNFDIPHSRSSVCFKGMLKPLGHFFDFIFILKLSLAITNHILVFFIIAMTYDVSLNRWKQSWKYDRSGIYKAGCRFTIHFICIHTVWNF